MGEEEEEGPKRSDSVHLSPVSCSIIISLFSRPQPLYIAIPPSVAPAKITNLAITPSPPFPGVRAKGRNMAHSQAEGKEEIKRKRGKVFGKVKDK